MVCLVALNISYFVYEISLGEVVPLYTFNFLLR